MDAPAGAAEMMVSNDEYETLKSRLFWALFFMGCLGFILGFILGRIS